MNNRICWTVNNQRMEPYGIPRL